MVELAHNLELVLHRLHVKMASMIMYFQMAQALAERRACFAASSGTTSSDTGVELLPVEITPDEQKNLWRPLRRLYPLPLRPESGQFLQGGIPSR